MIPKPTLGHGAARRALTAGPASTLDGTPAQGDDDDSGRVPQSLLRRLTSPESAPSSATLAPGPRTLDPARATRPADAAVDTSWDWHRASGIGLETSPATVVGGVEGSWAGTTPTNLEERFASSLLDESDTPGARPAEGASREDDGGGEGGRGVGAGHGRRDSGGRSSRPRWGGGSAAVEPVESLSRWAGNGKGPGDAGSGGTAPAGAAAEEQGGAQSGWSRAVKAVWKALRDALAFLGSLLGWSVPGWGGAEASGLGTGAGSGAGVAVGTVLALAIAWALLRGPAGSPGAAAGAGQLGSLVRQALSIVPNPLSRVA